MNQKLTFFILIIACIFYSCNSDHLIDNSLSYPEPIAVTTYQLQASESRVKIHRTGILTTENEVNYAFKIGGVIDRIFVNEGDFFKRGKLLATLKIDEIDAGFIKANLNLEKAERDFKRITNLYKDSVATLEQLQDTKTAFEIAQKQLETVSFNRDFAFIYAGFDGFVTKKIGNEGEIVSGGMPVLASNKVQNDSWVLKVGLSDREWAIIEPGNTATVVLDAFPDKILTGKVYKKSLLAEVGSGSFQIEIRVNCRGITPAVGMFGKATIETNNSITYQSIPYEALVEADGRNAYVFVPTYDGGVKKQAIEIADFDNYYVKVESGLEDVREVVFNNSAFLNSNSSITINKEKSR